MSAPSPVLAVVAIGLATVVSLARQTALLAQLAGFIVTGLSIGMAPCSAELARWSLAMLLHRSAAR